MAKVLREELDEEDLVVASSDLSHYHPEPVAQARDEETLVKALALEAEARRVVGYAALAYREGQSPTP